eukprot:Pompholyxophrys_punicea_v1_NODE_17_length_5980_cov_2.985654.p8 type:complete len:224 gc:universal NODE_17_length_5980_cov_2.985654:2413-3084(+)
MAPPNRPRGCSPCAAHSDLHCLYCSYPPNRLHYHQNRLSYRHLRCLSVYFQIGFHCLLACSSFRGIFHRSLSYLSFQIGFHCLLACSSFRSVLHRSLSYLSFWGIFRRFLDYPFSQAGSRCFLDYPFSQAGFRRFLDYPFSQTAFHRSSTCPSLLFQGIFHYLSAHSFLQMAPGTDQHRPRARSWTSPRQGRSSRQHSRRGLTRIAWPQPVQSAHQGIIRTTL